ncbi:MAG: hypothetical protein GY949_13845, partial [Gammaproteobacteria bacterium]|nr:hypothetical protein [Gammaproteobacteria bacterium]
LAEEAVLPVDSRAVVDTKAWFLANDDGREGTLYVTVNVREGYHIYATSQPKPFIATEIHVNAYKASISIPV